MQTSDEPVALERVAQVAARLEGELARAIVGQQRVIREILIAFLAGGHVLLRGVPGLAKTLLIKKLSEAVALGFNRIQSTPSVRRQTISLRSNATWPRCRAPESTVTSARRDRHGGSGPSGGLLSVEWTFRRRAGQR